MFKRSPIAASAGLLILVAVHISIAAWAKASTSDEDTLMHQMVKFEALINIPSAAAAEGSKRRIERAFMENEFSAKEKELIEVLYELFSKKHGTKEFEDNVPKILRLYPKEQALWIMIGQELDRLNDRAGAVESFKQALKIDPNCTMAKDEISKPTQEADTASDAVEPNDMAYFEERGNQALSAAVKKDKSLLKWAKLAGKDEHLVELLYDLYTGPRGAEAVDKMRPQLLQLFPKKPELWDVVGAQLGYLGDRAGAIICFKQALTFDPSDQLAKAELKKAQQ